MINSLKKKKKPKSYSYYLHPVILNFSPNFCTNILVVTYREVGKVENTRITESHNILSWEGPMRITESNS